MKNESVIEIHPPKEKIRRRNGIQVIARAAAVLRALRDAPDGLSLGEIAKTLDLPRSTVQRIVEALDQENFMITTSPSRRVRLGPAILALASATRFEFAEIAHKTIMEIAAECGETVTISILNGNRVVFLDQIPSTHRLLVDSPVGHSLPLISTAPGKAIMAIMEEEMLKKLRRRLHFDQYTSATISNWDDLLAELVRVRERGVAFDVEENSYGISAAGVALALPNGEYGAISIPVPAQRFAERQSQLAELLIRHCQQLEQALSGGRKR